MDQAIRNKLRNVVIRCRKLLEDAVSQELQGRFGIYSRGNDVQVEEESRMTHLSDEERVARRDIIDHFEHIGARAFKPNDALDQLIREIAFTHLNRLCAYKMMEAREVYVGGQKFREAVSRGINSNGFKFYLADHPEDERLFATGEKALAYQHFLDWLGGLLSEEIGVLFNPNDPANRLYPPFRVLSQVIDLLNGADIKLEENELLEAWPQIWSDDETIGWVYQFFTPKELRDRARRDSTAPRDSYELAFRNQFYTPRYVVEFLCDNTLGRIWYEMRLGDTKLKEHCRNLVCRPNECFLSVGQLPPKEETSCDHDLPHENPLSQVLYFAPRTKKDPRDLKVLDPACGSGHFLLYCFDLLLTIYEEAYSDSDCGAALRKDYATLEDLQRAVPGLILEHNVHGIDIDLRATQIAALALWLRCQRAYHEIGVKKNRPNITRSNVVCAGSMPGEKGMLREFTAELQPKVLGQLVEVVFEKMKLVEEMGPLLRIEEEVRGAVTEAKKQWLTRPKAEQMTLFGSAPNSQELRFDFSGLTDIEFFEQAEVKVIDTLRSYAERASGGSRFRRRLFVNDAVQGFDFLDLCRQRYDVVLMNPPFGECCDRSSSLLQDAFPAWNNNLLCAFIARAWEYCRPDGFVGVIYDRTAAIKSTYEDFRRRHLIPDDRIFTIADLGWGVLEANVEVTTTVLTRTPIVSAVITDVRDRPVDEKGSDLIHCIERLRDGSMPRNATIAETREFGSLPNAVIAYDLPRFLRRAFAQEDSLESVGFAAYQGHALKAEIHYRLFWELSADECFGRDRAWLFAFKGGDYSPFFLQSHYVALYGKNGSLVPKSTANVLRNKSLQLKPGVGYGKRGEFIDAQPLWSEHIFTHEGHAFPNLDPSDAWFLLGLLNSRLFQFGVNCYCGQHKHSGYINIFPFDRRLRAYREALIKASSRIHTLKSGWATGEETHWLFTIPHLFRQIEPNTGVGSLTAMGELALCELGQCDEEIARLESGIDLVVEDAYGVSEDEKVVITEGTSKRPKDRTWYDKPVVSTSGALHEFVAALFSYLVGCTFGRWDVRFVLDHTLTPALPPTFGPLPKHQLGALQKSFGDFEQGFGDSYPLRISWDGIMVDDPDNPADIVGRVREVLEIIWQQRAESIEEESCAILGARQVREYFRTTSRTGFWNDHINRYSKSSRKAPIYWLLQSPKKGYALWLYYERLDRDILFKALLNYVEPRIRHQENRLDSLRLRKAAATEGNLRDKKLDREIEAHDESISEMRHFKDTLQRVADLHLEPDLKDGVMLNISPLWELVPWKEAKTTWDELLEGKYEWSSIGKQLREKGIVK